MWFIGLIFAKSENLNVDLTYDIKTFTGSVHRQANAIKMFKESMQIEARHVKRKYLHQYLSPSLLKRERKNSSGNLSNTATTNTTTVQATKNGVESRKRLSDTTQQDYNLKKSRLSDEAMTNVSNDVTLKF